VTLFPAWLPWSEFMSWYLSASCFLEVNQQSR